MLGPVVAAGAEAAADGAVHAEVVGKVGGRAHGADGRRVGKPARQQTGKSAVQTIRQPLREAPQTGPPECLPGGGWAPGRRLDSGQSGSLTSAARGGRVWVWGLGGGGPRFRRGFHLRQGYGGQDGATSQSRRNPS